MRQRPRDSSPERYSNSSSRAHGIQIFVVQRAVIPRIKWQQGCWFEVLNTTHISLRARARVTATVCSAIATTILRKKGWRGKDAFRRTGQSENFSLMDGHSIALNCANNDLLLPMLIVSPVSDSAVQIFDLLLLNAQKGDLWARFL